MAMEFVKSDNEVVFSTRTAEEEGVQRELDRIESDRAEFEFECARLWESI